jgi:hypothetical protein
LLTGFLFCAVLRPCRRDLLPEIVDGWRIFNAALVKLDVVTMPCGL